MTRVGLGFLALTIYLVIAFFVDSTAELRNWGPVAVVLAGLSAAFLALGRRHRR